VGGVPPGDMVNRLNDSVKTENRLKESFGAWKRKEEARTNPTAANEVKRIVDDWIAKGRPEVVDTSDIPKLPENFNKHREILYEGGGNQFNRAKLAVISRDFPAIFDDVQKIIKPFKDAKGSGVDAATLRTLKSVAVSKLRDMTKLGAAKDDARVPVKVLMDFKRKGDVNTANMRKSSNWNVDHIAPLAAHWHAEGYNSNDDKRINTTPNITNLQLIAGDANKSAQAEYEGTKYDYMTKAPGPAFVTEKNVWG
jgi:hypothetical protein